MGSYCGKCCQEDEKEIEEKLYQGDVKRMKPQKYQMAGNEEISPGTVDFVVEEPNINTGRIEWDKLEVSKPEHNHQRVLEIL